LEVTPFTVQFSKIGCLSSCPDGVELYSTLCDTEYESIGLRELPHTWQYWEEGGFDELQRWHVTASTFSAASGAASFLFQANPGAWLSERAHLPNCLTEHVRLAANGADHYIVVFVKTLSHFTHDARCIFSSISLPYKCIILKIYLSTMPYFIKAFIIEKSTALHAFILTL
jgi:hypothetical protein